MHETGFARSCDESYGVDAASGSDWNHEFMMTYPRTCHKAFSVGPPDAMDFCVIRRAPKWRAASWHSRPLTWGSRTPGVHGKIPRVLGWQLSFHVFLFFLYPILEENKCRLKTTRGFCLILRCCDATM